MGSCRSSECRRDDQGAMAVLVALLTTVLFMGAAIAIDISTLAMERQRLHDHVDAAAHAGAFELPGNSAGAAATARSMALTQDASLTPDIDLWCIVASVGSGLAVVTSQIPATCNPGVPPYTATAYPGLRCDTSICAIPCFASQGDRCNAMRVSDQKTVPYGFARIMPTNVSGDTGTVSTVACKGSCGEELPNPLNVAVVADRTGSMSSIDVLSMISGIKSMLQVMTPSLQYVSLGTIGPAKSNAATTTSTTCRSDPYSGTLSSTGTAWKWMSLPFHKDYLTTGAIPTVNPSSNLVKAIDCLTRASSTGTHLAAPLKAAARYLLGNDPNNASALGARVGTVRPVIIFETDGQPNEAFSGGSTSLGNTSYPGSTNGLTACNNMVNVANAAKAQGILVITVAYNLSTLKCSGSTGTTVTGALASAASPDSGGSPSDADTACSNAAERLVENVDGDYFYCAASGDNMASIFVSAISAASTGIRFIRMP